MKRESLAERYSPFIAAAVLGAHANTRMAGFRQYDVRFMLEIFTNWISSAEGQTSLPIQNNQLARYLEGLVNDEFATQLGQKRKPIYRLTRTGLIEVISRLVNKTHYNPREHFYFVFSFVAMYAHRMIGFVRDQGSRFPYSLQIELESLMDPEALINRQIDHAKHELFLLERRLGDIKDIEGMVDRGFDSSNSYDEIITNVDKVGFFGFSTQRRFTEVFQMSTNTQGIWEMKVGNPLRELMLWEPSRQLLLAHLSQLELLKSSYKQWQHDFQEKWSQHEHSRRAAS